MRWRRLMSVGLMLPALLLLTGCLHFNADLRVLDEKQTQVTVTMTFPKAPSAWSGHRRNGLGDAQVTCIWMNKIVGSVGQEVTSSEQLDDAERYGCKVQWIQSEPTKEFPQIAVTHSDRKWAFRSTFDEVVPRTDSSVWSGLDRFMVEVTFPGEVLSHSGSSSVSGTKVTWTDPADYFSKDGLQATGRGPLNWRDFIVPAAGVGVVALLGLVTAASVRRSRRRVARQPGNPEDLETDDVVVPEEEAVDSSKPLKDFADD